MFSPSPLPIMLWLYDIPTWSLASLIVIVFLAVSLSGLWLSRHFVTNHLHFSKEINDAVNFFGTAIAALYSVTLGLIAVACWTNFSGVQGLVSKEASTIGVLYRDFGGYPPELCTDLRHQLRAYTQYVVEKSWPIQQHGGLDNESTLMVADLHEKLMSYRPANLGEMAMHEQTLNKFNEMADLRRQRADRVNDALPGILWIVLLSGGFLSLAASYFFYITDVRFHVLLQSMLTIFIALMIFLIVALDRPFQGEVSVSPASFVTIVKKLMDPLDARTVGAPTPTPPPVASPLP